MALTDVMHAIEQHRFSAEVNFAAGTKAFRLGLRNHQLVRELAELAKQPQARDEIVKRITTLASAEIDKRYENSFDAALSAYLTVLGDTAEPEVIAEAASRAASAQNCWWTVGVARELLMRAIATGDVTSAPVVYVDASVLMPGVRWKETLAERFRDWFAERRTASSVEAWSRVLRVLNDAQSAGQQNACVAAPPPENDQPIVLPSLRRRNRKRQRPPHRGTAIHHASSTARA
jgi:hypothetical protein